MQKNNKALDWKREKMEGKKKYGGDSKTGGKLGKKTTRFLRE